MSVDDGASVQHCAQGSTAALWGDTKQYGPTPGTKWQSPLA
jgi:hypothetical protein